MKQLTLLPGTITLALAMLCNGCAVVRSAPGTHGAEGIGYMLPKALLPVELVYDGSSFVLQIQAAILVGDTAHTYALQRSGNVFTSDNVVVNVDPATGLLTAINVKSEDKSADAITKLASGLKAEAADAITTVTVFRGLFDPSWGKDRVAAFNRSLQSAAKGHLARATAEQACDPQAVSPACKALQTLDKELVSSAFAVSVEDGDSSPGTSVDCSAGFCYRLNVPHVVRLEGPGTSTSAVFGLPNRSPTFVMPLERWAFVKTTHDVKLKGGVFESVTTDRPSSAYAVASVPFDIAKGTITSASELIQLKIDLSGKEKAFYEAQGKEIEAKAARDKVLVDKAAAKAEAEAAILGIRIGRDTPQLAIRVGQASQLDATQGLVLPKAGAGNAAEVPKNPDPLKSSGASGLSSGGSGGNADSTKK